MIHSPVVPVVLRSSNGDLDRALPAYYEDLRLIARSCLRSERPDHTLQATALVHEVYLRLASQYKVDWTSRTEVLSLAGKMMRRILLDYWDARNAQKRGAGLRVDFDLALESALDVFTDNCVDVASLDRALTKLESLDERQARVVELRFFSGLNIEETALALNVSPATVKREWTSARLFLANEVAGSRM